ncbi:MAG: aminoglycoside 6'-N-acetyltransferase [Leptolyngbyaceae cyanobacterium bins.302]|nr:aminoglycoside 6'-N-acetyltransferase [Leptolyngbyaceae cyanobacterium bins.302]
MSIRPVTTADAAEWLRMRCLLWEDGSDEHPQEIRAFYQQQPSDLETFVYDRGGVQLGGFVEVGIRAYAEGCDSDRVGYIEGLYVDADLRRKGVGSQLIQAAEQWARSQGMVEMASDCLIDNHISLATHLANGFEEVERIICFRKALSNG